LSAAAKTAVDIVFNDGYALGTIPSQESLGLVASGSYASKYVVGVSTDAFGVITVKLSADPGLATAKGGTVTYTPTDTGANLRWSVNCNFASKLCPKM
jgi:hypothetical protein